jgi:kynurenine formamidase
MKIIDITGPIYTGMWSYGPPFPRFELGRVPQPEWLEYPMYTEELRGMCGQTGTYLETPAHLLGYEKSYPLIDVPLAKLVDIPTYVLRLRLEELPEFGGRRAITREAISRKINEKRLARCRGIIISTGWGRNWRAPNFLESSPFIKYEAMDYLIGRKPFVVAADSPRWENLEKPEGFFPKFFDRNILLMSPCINLEQISKDVVALTALPLKVEGACAAPCRAFVKEP